jgi:hypothetical protein
MGRLIAFPTPPRTEPPVVVVDMAAEKRRLREERRQDVRQYRALRQARAENPGADLHTVIVAAIRILGGDEFPEFAASVMDAATSAAGIDSPSAPAAPQHRNAAS